jgi:hypothetical protein
VSLHSIKLAAAGDEQNPDMSRVSFADFWKAYPRRVARKDAEKAWHKIDAAEYPKILEAVGRQRKTEDWRRDGGRYIPYPASFLRGERWLDELEADLSMGQCAWNINGNRGPEPRCTQSGVTEKNGVVYCKLHGERV